MNDGREGNAPEDERVPERDGTICAEHRDGKSGEAHDWRRGRRGRTRLVTCHPAATDPSEGGGGRG